MFHLLLLFFISSKIAELASLAACQCRTKKLSIDDLVEVYKLRAGPVFVRLLRRGAFPTPTKFLKKAPLFSHIPFNPQYNSYSFSSFIPLWVLRVILIINFFFFFVYKRLMGFTPRGGYGCFAFGVFFFFNILILIFYIVFLWIFFAVNNWLLILYILVFTFENLNTIK